MPNARSSPLPLSLTHRPPLSLSLSLSLSRLRLDFYFPHRSKAQKFVDFLRSVVPTRSKSSKQLVSADLQNMTYNYKHTFAVEIMPICKGDLVCLPTKLANQWVSSLLLFSSSFPLVRFTTRVTPSATVLIPI